MKAATAASSSVFSMHPDATQESLVGSGRLAAARDCPAPAAVRLTARQLEVLALLCEGLPNKLICRELCISAGTVKAHISGILRELGVSSRLQAVVAARRAGFISRTPNAPARSATHANEEMSGHGTSGMVTLVDFGQRMNHRYTSSQSGR